MAASGSEFLVAERVGHVNITRSRCAALCAVLVLGNIAQALAANHEASHEWLSVQGDLNNQRFGHLDQINRRNISKLGAAWISDPFEGGATSRMTPLVHDGLMFFAAGSRIYALDARSGKRVWARQTETRVSTATGWQQMVTGLATTRSFGLGLGGGMIYAGFMNGHLIALAEKTGELVWDQLINTEPLSISKGIICTPLYVHGVLFVGLGMETTEGHALAVDAKSGQVLWQVPTVAEPGQAGHETWPQDSEIWRSGGAHPWASGAADPKLGLVYFVTGNASPAFGGQTRPGNNLYTVSLIALDMKTGHLQWYQQLIHHDVWEADLSVPPVLFDFMGGGGKNRPAIAAMRGDGYLFVFDRANGEPLIPVDERAVAQSAKLSTSLTQPYPRGAESILPPCESFRSKIPAGFVLTCMFDPPSVDIPNQLAQWASVRIAAMSFDPETRYFYAQGQNSLLWRRIGGDPYLGDTTNHSGDRIPNYPRPTVILAAIDSRNDKVVWRKELPAFDNSGYKSDGGALSTAGGLVFHQGGDGSLQAYDAKTGTTRWKFQTDYAVGDAPPMSYAIDGAQYVAFIAGTKVWAFALGGTLPAAPTILAPPYEQVAGPIEDAYEVETMTIEQTPANGRRYFANEFAFNPYRARVRAGSSVTFINNGLLPHTLVAEDGSWTTGTLIPTQIATLRFDKPGAYLYSSKEYPWSYGQIIVIPATLPAGPAAGSPETTAASNQLDSGKASYLASCAVCHGENLGGRDRAPALAGQTFGAAWAARNAWDLFERIRATMPQSAPGTLSDENYAAIVVYILSANGQSAAAPLDLQTLKTMSIIP
jgi:outer membrane protein assembly factor BamB/mono/diheme cytochrome c family protein